MEPVTAIATVPAVLALVTLAKDLGMPSRLAPVLALVLGVWADHQRYDPGSECIWLV